MGALEVADGLQPGARDGGRHRGHRLQVGDVDDRPVVGLGRHLSVEDVGAVGPVAHLDLVAEAEDGGEVRLRARTHRRGEAHRRHEFGERVAPEFGEGLDLRVRRARPRGLDVAGEDAVLAAVEERGRVEDRVVQALGEDGEAGMRLLHRVGDRAHERGALLGVGEGRRGVAVARPVARERREDAELVVEDAVRAEVRRLPREREHAVVPGLPVEAAERECVLGDVPVLVVRLDDARAVLLDEREPLAVFAPELRRADLLELAVCVDADADAPAARLGDAGLERGDAAHLVARLVVGVEVVVAALRPAEEADAGEAVARGDVAEEREVGVLPEDLPVLLAHDDEQPARHVLRPRGRGGADLARRVVPRAVALRGRVPVARHPRADGLGDLPRPAGLQEEAVVEGGLDAALVRRPAQAQALRLGLRVVRAHVERPVARIKRHPRHRQPRRARMEARVEGVAPVPEGVPARALPGVLPGVLGVLGRRGRDLRRARLREVRHAPAHALRQVEGRVGGVEAHALEVRPLEGRHADARVVVRDPARVGRAARVRARLHAHLHVPGLAAVRQAVAREAPHAGGGRLLAAVLARAGEAHRATRAGLFERERPLGKVLRIEAPLHVVEDDVARVLEPAVREPRAAHAEVAPRRTARLGDLERHVRETPVAHVVLGTELEDGRALRAEAAVRERDVPQERDVLRAADADVERRVEAVDRHVREAHVLHAERHDLPLRGRHDAASARRVDVLLRGQRIAHRGQVELDAEARVGADDVVEGDVADRPVARPADADRALVRAQDAVREDEPLAGPHRAHLLLVRAHDERVVLRVDEAVAHRHVAAAAEVEAVAVRELAVAGDAHAPALHAVAVEEPRAPPAGVVDEDVVEAHVPAADEEDAASRDVRVADALPAAVDAAVERLGVAVDRARARDRHVRLPHGVEQRALVEARGPFGAPHVGRTELGVFEGILPALQRRAPVDVEIDVVLEVERVGLVDTAPRHEDAPAPLRGTGVDGLLDGGRVVGGVIGARPEPRDVERVRARPQRRERQEGEESLFHTRKCTKAPEERQGDETSE